MSEDARVKEKTHTGAVNRGTGEGGSSFKKSERGISSEKDRETHQRRGSDHRSCRGRRKPGMAGTNRRLADPYRKTATTGPISTRGALLSAS